MAQAAITVENLSKAYRLGAKEEAPDTLMSAVVGAVRYPIRNFNRLRSLSNLRAGDSGDDVLWALKDVSFEVNEGEVVGIIGRNGAGKSTLLKILSRITEPTSGRAVIRGRVSSLLEVGTGFHPELTGRENIYMNGTILGMTKREIDRKFDEIVDFSGVEKFLDTPTKRYSSGMQVRLAFAVAAHLEPEILIIDEVLAVGDAEFQKKCLGKMQDVAAGGRTVLFVSHNMAAVKSLCNRGVVMEYGKVADIGETSEVVQAYLRPHESTILKRLADRTDRTGAGKVRLEKISIEGNGAKFSHQPTTGEPAVVRFVLSAPASRSQVSFIIKDSSATPVASFHSRRESPADRHVAQPQVFECGFDELPLLTGRYSITAAVWGNGLLQDRVEDAFFFDVANGPFQGRLYSNPNAVPGAACLPHNWVSRHSAAESAIGLQ